MMMRDDVLWSGHRNVLVGGANRALLFTLHRPTPPHSAFKIFISDDEDPCFLAQLMITRNDYEELKKLQGLLVDFDNFPMRLVKLLEQCAEHPNMYISLQQLPTHTNFEIIEHNEFRKLIHLSMKMSLATDTELKRHMAEYIISLKKTMNEQSSQLAQKDSQLGEIVKLNENKIQMLNDTLRSVEENMQRLKIEHQETLKREHEKYENEKFDWKKCAEFNTKTQTISLQETLSRKERQLEEALQRSKQMQEALKSLESQVIDKTQKILLLEQQMHTIRQDAEIWKNQNGVLGKDFHEKDLNLQQTRNRLSDLEKILKEKSDLLRETLDSFQTLKKEKLLLEEKHHMNELSLTENKQTLKETNEQLLKANQIISKLNSDMIELKEKLVCRTAIALEQEKVIEQYTAEKEKMETKERETAKELNEIKENLETLKKENHTLKTNLLEKDDIIKNNNSVIQWLHKKMDSTHCETQSSKTGDSVYNSTAFMSVKTHSTDNGNGAFSHSSNRRSEPPGMKLGLRDNDSSDEYSVDPVYLRPLSTNTRLDNAKNKDTKPQNGARKTTISAKNRITSNNSNKPIAQKGSLASAYFPKS